MIWFMHIKKGKLHRSFVGYAIQHSDLLIGLGASTMSDSWTVFA
jgi:oxygen-independent coproporphyrinogen-3 oxidase